MKKFPCIFMLALLTFGGCKDYDDSFLRNEVNDLNSRIAALEQWAATVNSNITALQGVITASQEMNYVTGVTPFASPAPGGYIISFLKGETIAIFNGTDGKDGESPQISVQRDADGVYCWTLNGEWILVDGNRVRVTGENGAGGQDGVTPQLRINSGTGIWEVSYDEGGTWLSLGVKATGADGQDGQNGVTPQLRVNSGTGIWEVSYNGGSAWTSLGVAAAGAGGQDGVTPQLRINSGTGMWEVSYTNGSTWLSLGVRATGADGQDGITPQLRVNSGTGIWEVSYNGGAAWLSLGVAAAGADGKDGRDGVSPMIRINTAGNIWEISCNNGESWESTGIAATGAKGDKGDAGARGDAIFAANGVDYSKSDCVEFTLADGVTKIRVPKYAKLGLNFTQPGTFAAGETKTV
ncbi:MAG: DUF4988 domain-containing protein, partial [Bacteroidales bacterium]|nr:DUF4988 domain-containing protein [Bacteroidales bacterium]